MSSNLEAFLSATSSYTQNELFEGDPEDDTENPTSSAEAETGEGTSTHVRWKMDAHAAAPSAPAEWQEAARDPGTTGPRLSLVRFCH